MIGLCAAAIVALVSWTQLRRTAPVVLSAEERAFLAAHGPLRFAADPSFPPIESFDEHGRHVGLVADLFERIEQRLGVPIEIVRYATWEEALEHAKAGDVDGLTAAQRTPEREVALEYGEALLDVPNVIVVREDHGGHYTLEALGGHTVAVTEGNALHEYLRQNFPEIRVVPQRDDLACLHEVSFGRADATVVNLAIASHLIRTQGLTELRVAGDSGRSNALAIATHRSRPRLRGILGKGLAALTPSEREEIARRWIDLDRGEAAVARTLAMLLAAALGAMALGALGFVQWNRALRREVTHATEGLQAELQERRRAEEALRRSQARLASHLDQTLFFVVEWDAQLRVCDWNPAAERTFGFTRAEALGRTAEELILAPSAVEVVERIRAGLAAGSGGRHSVNENRTRDGRMIVCEWFNTSLRDAEGRILGALSIGHDVTDRTRTAEALSRTQRLEALAVLAGGLAHDFNNLLAGILANVSYVDADERLPAELREALADAEAAAQRARGLTQQLLTFAKGGAPVKHVQHVEEPLRQAAAFVTSGWGGSCRVEAAEGLWPAEVDVDQLSQVVQNLVLNAVEAMPTGGHVTVTLENVSWTAADGALLVPGPFLCLRVIDDGPGIPAELLPRIFDPFVSTKQRGSGLGLSVCHSVVARHAGAIRVLPPVGGRGTVFEVLLPAAPGAEADGEPPKATPGRPVLPAKVLVMDDEEVLRRLVVRVLSAAGARVETAADGEEALRCFLSAQERGAPFDVVILDLTVPGGLGGVATLEGLRACAREVRAIVSSGYSDDPVMSEWAAHGFVGALPKPFTDRELLRAVEQVVARQGAT